MPGFPRIARATVSVGANSPFTVALPLPAIPGQLIVPSRVQFSINLATAAEGTTAGLSHDRDSLGEADNSAIFEDEDVWIYGSLNTQAQIVIDLIGSGIELAGPQRLVGFMDNGATRVIGCLLWYTTRTVSELQWAQIATLTSFEA